MPRVVFLFFGAAIICAGCGDSQRAERERLKRQQQQAEIALFSNPTTAVAELEKRIRKWIAVQNGYISIREEYGDGAVRVGVSVAPTSIPWVISCRFGMMTLILGTWVDGDDHGVSNTFEKNLTSVPIREADEDYCPKLALKAAERMSAILKGE